MKLLDNVKLLNNIPEENVKSGDIGTIVLVHDNQNFTVEFITNEGCLLGLVTKPSYWFQIINKV